MNRRIGRARWVLAVAAALALALWLRSAPASAGVIGPACRAAGTLNAMVGQACSGGAMSGGVGSAVGGASNALAAFALGTVVAWTTGGARLALSETSKLLAASTRPRLQAPWFSRVYWRVAAIAALLTLPFLFAAAVQALLRSDLALLLRAAFGYLPLAMLGVAVAAQVTALLLSVTDELCSLVSAAAGNAAPGFLSRAGRAIVALSLGSGSPFLAFVIGAFTVAGAVALWTELLIRDAAVYVIVVMLPLAFAALVWPARRVWALRGVEMLVALILAKLAVVTVLTLGGAALESVTVAGFLAGFVLLMLAVFAPWAMLRLVPVAELAAGAAGGLRGEAMRGSGASAAAHFVGGAAHSWLAATLGQMRREEQATNADRADTPSPAEADDPGGADLAGGPRGRESADAAADGSGAGVPTAVGAAAEVVSAGAEGGTGGPGVPAKASPGLADLGPEVDDRGPLDGVLLAPNYSWGKLVLGGEEPVSGPVSPHDEAPLGAESAGGSTGEGTGGALRDGADDPGGEGAPPAQEPEDGRL